MSLAPAARILNPPMKVFLLNDTAVRGQHAGSHAVMRSIRHKLVLGGHEIVGQHSVGSPIGSCPRLLSADAVVVNGEGTLHHGRKHARALMQALARAAERGQRTYLANALYEEMPREFDAVLRGLDGLWVRDWLSLCDVRKRGATQAILRLDSACDPEFLQFGRPLKVVDPLVLGRAWPRRAIRPDKRAAKWSTLYLEEVDFANVVATLSMAEEYVTGQYHGVLAAGLAGIRFTALPVNSWKVQGLFAWFDNWAGSPQSPGSGVSPDRFNEFLRDQSVWRGLEDTGQEGDAP